MKRITFILTSVIIFLGAFSFSVVMADSGDIILRVGEKKTIPGVQMELLLENIDNSGTASFYLESELIKLMPGESKTIKNGVVSLINSSYEEKYVTFRVIIEPTPPPVITPLIISPDHASDKIVRHGYVLIDAYIKELSEKRCTFPDGQFMFFFNGGAGKNVSISPACIPPTGIWRNISFINADNTAKMIILDGPVSGTPGTPNEKAIKGAINDLSARLLDSAMLVKIVYKDGPPDLNFDLSKESDFQKFIDLMFATIKLSKPLASGPIPAAKMTLPEGTLLKINPGNKRTVEIEGNTVSVEIVQTKAVFNGQKKDVKLTPAKKDEPIKIEIEGKTITTKTVLEIKETKLYLETANSKEEIKITPLQALNSVGLKEPREIQLEEKNQKPIYSVAGMTQAKLFSIIPVRLEISAEVDAQSGKIISIRKPWWAFLAR